MVWRLEPEYIGSMTSLHVSIHWQRQDVPGEDCCRLVPDGKGWTLIGKAAYLEKGTRFEFAYRVQCGADWGTVACRIRGRIGERAVRWDYRRLQGTWFRDGVEVPELDPWLDIDLGFTPATNLAQLRRLNLAVGQASEMPVAWMDPETGSLSYLPQHYRRLSDTRYAYASPTVGYAETLEVDPVTGFALRYPGLWVAAERARA
jgi:hypothetical protein